MTNVLIPAFEARGHIDRTLRALPRSAHPIVAVNGPDDGTYNFLDREYGEGIELYRSQEAGKDLAVKTTIEHMGDRADDPIIILDADTVPLNGAWWLKSMVRSLVKNSQDETGHDIPTAVGGMVYYTGDTVTRSVVATLRTGFRIGTAINLRHQEITENTLATKTGNSAQFSPNFGLFMRNAHNRSVIVDSSNLYWLGEDRRYAAATIAMGGAFRQNLDPRAICLSPLSDSYPSAVDTARILLVQGFDGLRDHVHSAYEMRTTKSEQTFISIEAERYPG